LNIIDLFTINVIEAAKNQLYKLSHSDPIRIKRRACYP